MNEHTKMLQSILKKAFQGEVSGELLQYFQRSTARFEAIQQLSSEQIARLIQPESLQVMACILAYLKPEVSANVLKHLPKEIVPDLLVKFANLGEVSSEWLDQVDEFFDRMVPMMSNHQKIGGISSVVKMLQTLKEEDQKAQLKLLEARDRELAITVKNQLFVFEGLVSDSDLELQSLIRKTSSEDWLLALRGASDGLREAYLRNVSSRIAEDICARLINDPRVPKSKVEEAQQRILQARLKSSGSS